MCDSRAVHGDPIGGLFVLTTCIMLPLLPLVAASDELEHSAWKVPSHSRTFATDQEFTRDFWHGQRRWRLDALQKVQDVCAAASGHSESCANRDLYEFGVYLGRSMKAVSLKLSNMNVTYRTYWGFDSFQGLPEEAADVKKTQSSANWIKGTWSAASQLDDYSFASIEQRIRENMKEGGQINQRIQYVRGFYN